MWQKRAIAVRFPPPLILPGGKKLDKRLKRILRMGRESDLCVYAVRHPELGYRLLTNAFRYGLSDDR